MLPDFLGIGAGKAGTSWLHVCLEEHPDICVPAKRKEVDYFTFHHDRGLSWYEAFFDHHQGEKAVGEISPSYAVLPEAVERIYAWNPKVKLLFILREPVERAYSFYCMMLRSGGVSDDPEKEIHPDSDFVQGGYYGRQLKRFLAYFPKEQIKVLLYDQLERDPHGLLRDVYTFLGVDPEFVPDMVGKRFHATKGRPKYQALYNGLVKTSIFLSERLPPARWCIQLARKKGWVNVIHRVNQGEDFPEWSKYAREKIAEGYQSDLKELAILTGLDISGWTAHSS